MKGKFAHNQLLITPVAAELQRQGAAVHFEYAIGPRGRGGAVDVLAVYAGRRFVFEAERSPDRVPRDMEKAARLAAARLVIIAPDAAMAKAVRRKLARLRVLGRLPRMPICCLTIGVALQQIRNGSLLKSPCNDGGTSRHLTNQPTPERLVTPCPRKE